MPKEVSINEGADSKLQQTSGSQRKLLLRGTEGAWITARRNNWCYFLNKMISMGTAAGIAVITLYLKLMAMKFIKAHDSDPSDDDESQGAYNHSTCFHMQQIFWMMFIYQCMVCLDEFNEAVSQMMSVDKGALGMFFELNTLVGMFLTGYISYFIVGVKKLKFGGKQESDKDKAYRRQYVLMRNWIYLQFVWFIVCFFLMCPIYGVFYGINKKVTRRISATSN